MVGRWNGRGGPGSGWLARNGSSGNTSACGWAVWVGNAGGGGMGGSGSTGGGRGGWGSATGGVVARVAGGGQQPPSGAAIASAVTRLARRLTCHRPGW
jgi:hypothetical protein